MGLRDENGDVKKEHIDEHIDGYNLDRSDLRWECLYELCNNV